MSEQFRKRIETIFAGFDTDERYEENPQGNKFLGDGVVPSPWVEFQLIGIDTNEYTYGITFQQLQRLSKLLGTDQIEINGWSDPYRRDSKPHQNVIAIAAYGVKFPKPKAKKSRKKAKNYTFGPGDGHGHLVAVA